MMFIEILQEVNFFINSVWPILAFDNMKLWVNVGLGNGLLLDGTKPLPDSWTNVGSIISRVQWQSPEG